MAFLPYLNFGGNGREAFTCSQEIFGGELFVMAMSDLPDDEPAPEGTEDLVMHAALNFTTSDLDDAERVFAALSEGGTIEMPMEETFWAPRFGVVVDRFGTPWMVNGEAAQE